MLSVSDKRGKLSCSVHNFQLKRKRKSNLQTIDNNLKDDVEFREVIVVIMAFKFLCGPAF